MESENAVMQLHENTEGKLIRRKKYGNELSQNVPSYEKFVKG
jgi:hypothetical protein